MVFVELPLFQKHVTFGDDELRALQQMLIENPLVGDPIKGGDGLRKMRVALPGRGKSGGARVIYFWWVLRSQCYLVFAYPKNEQEDLTDEQLKTLVKLMKEVRSDG